MRGVWSRDAYVAWRHQLPVRPLWLLLLLMPAKRMSSIDRINPGPGGGLNAKRHATNSGTVDLLLVHLSAWVRTKDGGLA